VDATILERTPGLGAVGGDALRALARAGSERRLLAPGEILYREGDAFHGCVYLVAQGTLEQLRAGETPRRAPPGYLLGLSSYFSQAPYSATVRAGGPAAVLAVAQARLRALEKDHPQLAQAFDRFIGESLRRRRVSIPAGSGALTTSVRSVMSAPLRGCSPATTLRDAVAAMREAGTGSLVLEGTDSLITFETLAVRLAEPGIRAGEDTVREAGREVTRVQAGDPLWKAQDLALRNGAKYLLVVEQDRPVGMLSQTDVVRALVARQAQLAAAVRDAPDVASLRERYQDMHELAAEFLQGNRLARLAVRSLSEAHLAVQARCVELTLAELAAQGAGSPPAPFALIVMGSGGRREMLLDPDQDNGLILDDRVAGDARAAAWFETFAGRLNAALEACGYALCPGDIMARNRTFRKTLSQWKEQVTYMSERPSEKAARWSNIMFDFDTQHGEDSLTRRLREHVLAALAQRPRLLHYMVDDDARGRAALGWFGRLVATGERDGKSIVDVKRNGLRMVVNAARILSLHEGIGACNTSDRIDALARAGALGAAFRDTLLDAYDELLGILLSHQIRQRREGREPDKQVAPEDLTELERESLRVSLRAVRRFQERLQDQVGGHAGDVM